MENYRDTFALVNLKHLKDNTKYIYEKAQKPMMAIVKANAYGHGSIQVSQALQSLDMIQMFGVATLGEGIELRSQGIIKDILVLGATRIEDAIIASRHDISISVFSMEFAMELEKVELDIPLKLHIKLDTGMNRIGLKGKEEFETVLNILNKNRHLVVEGVFTHYGAADELNHTYDEQFNAYKTIVGEHKFKYMHAANTAGALYHHEDFTNMVRAGIALYGIEPNGNEITPLKQVMSLKTRVVMVKALKKGERVGYGFTYRAKHDCYIATVPIGYADGIVRKNQNRFVLINDRYYQIVGRVCMDQMMIKVDDTVKVGDEVEIFGEQITLNQMAKELETIPYEILVLLSLRVQRVYVDEDLA